MLSALGLKLNKVKVFSSKPSEPVIVPVRVMGSLNVSSSVFAHILRFLGPTAWCDLSLMSSALHEAACDNVLWENAFSQRFPVAYTSKYKGLPPVHYLGIEYVSGWKALLRYEASAMVSSQTVVGKGWGKVRQVLKMFVPERRVVIMGLDGAGKTSILYFLKLGVTRAPSGTNIGVNVETLESKDEKTKCWDPKGDAKGRLMWPHYTINTQLIIFVVDASDGSRLGEAHAELRKLIDTTDVPILVFANKQDVPGAMGVREITNKLGLDTLPPRRKWYAIATSALTGDGVWKGFEWVHAIFENK